MPASEASTIDDLALLKDAAAEAGAIAGRAFASGAKTWTKPGGSPVTEADIAVDTFLKARLRAARPDYGWLSEETADDPARLSARRVFIVDPIDGTSAFVRRRSDWVVSVALVEAGAPIAGVAVNPLREETFSAARRRGAFLNDAPLRVEARIGLAGARLVGPRKAFAARAGQAPWPEVAHENFGSLAYRLCSIAGGTKDGAVSLSLSHEWDVAAALLILEEAGGLARELAGGEIRFNRPRPLVRGVVAGRPGLFEELAARVADLAPAPGPDG